MIAKNMLRFAEAMALQLPLPFGPLRMLKQARPTTRTGRAARAARAVLRRALLKVRVIYPTKPCRCPSPPKTKPSMFQMPLAIGLDLVLF